MYIFKITTVSLFMIFIATLMSWHYVDGFWKLLFSSAFIIVLLTIAYGWVIDNKDRRYLLQIVKQKIKRNSNFNVR